MVEKNTLINLIKTNKHKKHNEKDDGINCIRVKGNL